jgi:outer membrane lipoprotein-sorting protein
MKKALLTVMTVFLVLSFCGFAAAAEKQDAKQIMKASLDMMKLSNMESVSTLIVYDANGNKRVRKFKSASKDFKEQGVKKTIMKFLEPADVKGTGFLTFEYTEGGKDNDMWMYMPALRKTRRIVSGEKAKSFMGSEFSNSDISSPKLDEYKYSLLPDEKINDIDCWKIELLPASQDVADEYGYSKKEMWIGKADYICRKAEYYDLDGKLIKVMTTQKVNVLDKDKGLYQAADITIENVQNSRKSQFLMDKSAINPDMKDNIFTTDYLQK